MIRSSASLLVIGASGRVGRLLAAAWETQGANVILAHRAGRQMRTRLPCLNWSPVDGSLALAKQLAGHDTPSTMVLLSGVTPSTGTDMALNESLAVAGVRAARDLGIARILLASSSAVYGRGREEAWKESDEPYPTSDYGLSKLRAEQLCAGPDVTALRIGNVAGADALLTNTKRPIVMDQFRDGGTPERSYIGPVTMARVLRALGDALQLPPVLNIGAPVPVTMGALASAAGLPVTMRDAPPTAVQRLVLNCAALESLVPFSHSDSTATQMISEWRMTSQLAK